MATVITAEDVIKTLQVQESAVFPVRVEDRKNGDGSALATPTSTSGLMAGCASASTLNMHCWEESDVMRLHFFLLGGIRFASRWQCFHSRAGF